MRLTEQELEIFRAARAMYDGPYWGYICAALGRAGLSILPSTAMNADYVVMANVTDSLGDAIVASMRGLNTFEMWFHEETGYRTGGSYLRWNELTPKRPVAVISIERFSEYLVMGRMAWLDKIIETGEIL